jgi:1,4-dihydroxy-2-naphthoate octaprenyltransferase
VPADGAKREIATALVTLGRPRFVMAGFLLFVLGCLSAVCLGAPFSAGRFTWGYAIVGFAHFGVHYLNDYADRFSDNPDCRSPVSGGSGILPRNPELAGTALVLAVLLSLTSVLLTVGFVLFFSWSSSFILFVLAGILLSWSYSAPPVRLCGRCLGESATMLAFGLFLPGSGYFVMNGSLDTRFFLFTLPLLVLGFFFILSVELPDLDIDRLSGKRNLVVRFGRPVTRYIIAMAGLAGTGMYLILAWEDLLAPCPLWGICLASLIPAAAGVTGVLLSSDDRQSVAREATRNVGSLILFVLLNISLILGTLAYS